MYRRTADADRRKCSLPHLAEPPCRSTDVVGPQRVGSRQENIDPQRVAGLEQHRTAAAAPTHHVDSGATALLLIDVGDRLRRAEHDRRTVDLEPPDRWYEIVGHLTIVERLRSPPDELDVPHASQHAANNAAPRRSTKRRRGRASRPRGPG